MTHWREHLSLGLLAAFLVALCGCGDAQRPFVKGRVTLDGQPVGPGGHILFLPSGGGEGRKASAAIDAGTYEIPAESSPSPGPCRVEITWDKKTGKQTPSADPGFMMEETRQAIPPKYNRESQLSATIGPGENVYNFDLQSR